MNDYNEIAQKIKDADAILIGASNGLSITEGLNLFADDETFENLFKDYKEKYGFQKILDGFFFQWKNQEEKWGFFSRLINHYSGNYTTSSVMEDLKTIVGDKPYFILTSNGEGHFEMSGFEPQRVYELEGNWIELRCSRLCHDKTYPALPIIRKLAEVEKNGIVPFETLPRCPVCGAAIGALLGFLVFNSYPAKVFMGDTGSLALGGFVASVAILTKMPIMLVIVGFVYVCESLSVMIQVGYFKLTGGKRIFKMAPIHHHFELSGLQGIKVVELFTIATAVLCLLGFVASKNLF